MYRHRDGVLEFLLAHPGGPFWKGKDRGAWTIPKGELKPGELPLTAAKREFEEELGIKAGGPLVHLTPVQQKGGKVVHAWAFEGNCEPSQCRSITFNMEWPPGSGKLTCFPEIDRVAFFSFAEAAERINSAQLSFLLETRGMVSAGTPHHSAGRQTSPSGSLGLPMPGKSRKIN